MPDTAGSTPALTAHLHGAAHLLAAGGARVALERKQALLLAYLWIEGPTPRGKLAGLLWPDVPEARARGNLRQRLAVLRQAAGADAIVDSRGVLGLAPAMAVQPAGAASAPLLAAFEYDDCEASALWLEGQREAQRSQQRAGLLAEVRAAVQSGELDEALHLADRLLALDRESEEAYRTQMEVLYLRGDAAAAIAVWDRCKDMLRQLYGVLPSATTRALGETILRAAASAGRAPTTVPQAIPVTVLRPPRLIARQPLLQSLIAAWRGGGTPFVSGEAGLGKSRLLAEFATAVGPCAIVSARPGDASLPYASLGRLLLAAIDRFEPALTGDDARQAARLLPRLADLLHGDEPAAVQTDYERRQCLRAVARLFADCAARDCRALIFDDLQFADPASVEAVIEMAEAASIGGAAAPPRFVFGSRDEAAAGERFQRIELQPLDQAGVAELIESLGLQGFDAGSLAQRLWRQVGGNPAFVLESVKLVLALGGEAATGQGNLPLAPDIVAVIERRIGLLSPQARHLAQLAAIAGESYSVPLAAAALACAPLALGEPLRELELRQVLYGRQFVHDVIAVAVARTIAQSVAEFMHRFVAEYLEQHGGEPARVAAHWQACGEPRRAGDAYRAAAALAADASRPVEQSQLLDAAAGCFEQAGAIDALFDVLEARQEIAVAPDFAVARQRCMERMEALARTDEQRLRALLCRQGWEADHGHTASAEAGLKAMQQALALGHGAIAFEFARATAWRFAMRGDEALALQTLEAQRPWAMAQGTVAAQIELHCALSGVLGFVDRLGPAIDEARRAVADLRSTGRLARMLPMLSNMGLLLHWRGELAEARTVLSEAAQLRDRMHGSGSALVIDVHLGAVLRDLGEHDAAERVLVAAIAELRRRGGVGDDAHTDAVLAENHLAQLWLARGEPARALALLAGDDAGLAPRFRGRRIALRLRAARAQGRADTGLLAQAQALVDTLDSPFNRALLEIEVACALPPTDALVILTRLLGAPAPRERPGLLLHLAARAAQAELALGELARARRHVEHVQALLPSFAPFDIERDEVARIVADVLRA